MDTHVDLELIAQIIAFAVMALVGGIAWGKLNEKVKKHDELVEGCHMEDFQTVNGCDANVAACPGANHANNTYQRVVRIESDISEMKADFKTSDDRYHESQLHLGSTISRIETQLGMLLDSRGVKI
jgi:hypothetical protein